MEKEIENLDSPNEENDIEEANTEDVSALKEKNKELSDKNRQLFERAKKAEGFEKKDGKWVKVEKPEPKPEKPISQPDEPDYAKLAFLEVKGVQHPDDIKIVQDEATRLKLSLSDVLQMEHIKSRLTTNKEQRDAQAAMPHGSNRSGGAIHDVDYWLAKGGLPDDQKLAEKVVDARMGASKGPKFSDTMFNE